MVASKLPIYDLPELPDGALRESGASTVRNTAGIANNPKACSGLYRPLCHSPGYPVHFHVIPIYDWVEGLFWRDDRYRLLQRFAEVQGEPDTDGAELTLFGGSFVRGRILQGKIPSPLHWPRGRLVTGAAQGCAKAKLGGLRKCFVAGSSEPSSRKAFEHSCDLAGETACHREPTGFPFQPRGNFA
jgi:hypothetical protein